MLSRPLPRRPPEPSDGAMRQMMVVCSPTVELDCYIPSNLRDYHLCHFASMVYMYVVATCHRRPG